MDPTSLLQRKFCHLLNSSQVAYVALGGFALRHYHEAASFQALQLWLLPQADNYQRLRQGLNRFGLYGFDLRPERMLTPQPDSFFSYGQVKSVALYNEVPGLPDFDSVRDRAPYSRAGGAVVPVLSRDDLDVQLRAANRLTEAGMLASTENPGVRIAEALSWEGALPLIDAPRLLAELGFTRQGFPAPVYAHPDGSLLQLSEAAQGTFFQSLAGHRGDLIDLLRWRTGSVSAASEELITHLGGLESYRHQRAVGALLSPRPPVEAHAPPPYTLSAILQEPTPLMSERGLHFSTIYRPEFFKQVVDASYGGEARTGFPLRTAEGVRGAILSRGDERWVDGQQGGGLWLSNPLVELRAPVRFTIDRPGKPEDVELKAGTRGALVATKDPGRYSFYYEDARKGNEDLPYAKINLSAGNLRKLESVLLPLQVERLVVATHPEDALSLHQICPPVRGENRLYVALGPNPTFAQLERLRQLTDYLRPVSVAILSETSRDGLLDSLRMLVSLAGSPDLGFALQVREDSLHLRISGSPSWSQRLVESLNDQIPVDRMKARLETEGALGQERVLVLPASGNRTELHLLRSRMGRELEERMLLPAFEFIQPRSPSLSDDLKLRLEPDVTLQPLDAARLSLRGEQKTVERVDVQTVLLLANGAKLEDVQTTRRERSVPGDLTTALGSIPAARPETKRGVHQEDLPTAPPRQQVDGVGVVARETTVQSSESKQEEPSPLLNKRENRLVEEEPQTPQFKPPRPRL